ncbi:MAG: hypothetical protein NTU53_01415 [Planctomycetota bacterium]|nr:hypothetical protein [Planctomycetota bacterium]
MRIAGVVIGVVAMVGVAAAAENRVDEAGRLERLGVGVGWVNVRTELRVPTKGWSRTASLSGTQGVRMTAEGGKKTWKGSLGQRDGAAVAVEQSVSDEGAKVVFDVKAAGEREGEIEGVFFEVRLPAGEFAGGTMNAGGQVMKVPTTLPAERVLGSGAWEKLRIEDEKGNVAVCVEVPPGMMVNVTDNRKWEDWFIVSVGMHKGSLVKGQSVGGVVRVWAEGQVDVEPAKVVVDGGRVRYRMMGMGGNYCFGIDSPVAKFTMENLRVATSRTEMSLRAWEPVNVGGEGLGNDYREFAKTDVVRSRLRQEFELMGELTRKKIPFTTSIWRMPGWMTEAASERDAAKRRIPESKWGDVLQSVGSYLVYAKEKYGAEPDYFSFNEPDIGIDILFTAEEHRDAIKRFGERFEKLGLRTKLILGDVANARGTDQYCLPTANDAAAMKYVGAVAFHSWNGASAQQYAAWGDLAERLKKPLFVNEAGVDPSAWRGATYRFFSYAVRDMVHYQELLLHARPQSVIYWEFTGDYSLMAGEDSRGNVVTERFCLQKHWCNLTPAGSEALGVTCDNRGVLATVFRGAAGYTVHLANPKWGRSVVVEGLPGDVKELKVVRTGKGEMFKGLGVVKVEGGRVRVELPRESLTTLTTMQ